MSYEINLVTENKLQDRNGLISMLMILFDSLNQQFWCSRCQGILSKNNMFPYLPKAHTIKSH